MSNVAIKAEDISKAYQLGEFSTGTISRDIERWYAKLRGKEDPFLRLGETNDRTSIGGSNIVWSLKDINFEINKGDAVGIIGRNGAGKSTLLKVLSRVTAPTTGKIGVMGRIASLLEVGTGFHPELTGRENIFLNGAILGMRKAEIKRKFDEIVDFSGVARYVDTPVKRYSSGMYVRLAFAVAAHLESEILIVDEVLAVGDAEFQKKCLGKMGDVSKGEGRTILFVSHNMSAIQTLCTKGIVMENGMCVYEGDIDRAISRYVKPPSDNNAKLVESVKENSQYLYLDTITINGQQGTEIYMDDNILNVKVSGTIKEALSMTFGLVLYDENEVKLAIYSPGHTTGEIRKFTEGIFKIEERIVLPAQMTKGRFRVEISLHHPNIEMYMSTIKDIGLHTKGFVAPTGLEFDYKGSGLIIL